MRTMTTLSFAGSGDRDARDRNLLFPSLLGACYFRQICPFHRRFCDFALTHPPLQGFTGETDFAHAVGRATRRCAPYRHFMTQ